MPYTDTDKYGIVPSHWLETKAVKQYMAVVPLLTIQNPVQTHHETDNPSSYQDWRHTADKEENYVGLEEHKTAESAEMKYTDPMQHGMAGLQYLWESHQFERTSTISIIQTVLATSCTEGPKEH